VLFRSAKSDEDGGRPANITASGASNQTQRDALAGHRRGAGHRGDAPAVTRRPSATEQEDPWQ